MNILFVAIGGFFGSISRFYISEKANKRRLGTWLANITGSIFLAFMLRLYITAMISDLLWLLLGVGFCGAYTTFSTFGNETLQLILDKKYAVAVGYIFASISVSLFFVAVILYLF